MGSNKYKPITHNHSKFIASSCNLPGFQKAYKKLKLKYKKLADFIQTKTKQ